MYQTVVCMVTNLRPTQHADISWVAGVLVVLFFEKESAPRDWIFISLISWSVTALTSLLVMTDSTIILRDTYLYIKEYLHYITDKPTSIKYILSHIN